MKHTYSEIQLREAISTSLSYAQVLIKLNIIPAGGNYSTLKKRISSLSLNTDHFKGQAWNKGLKSKKTRSLNDYLSNKFSISSNHLRKRLINDKIFQHKCNNCQLETWLNNPIPLELDHIDGNHKNNNLKNLRLLCPNCHSLTPTFRRSKKYL